MCFALDVLVVIENALTINFPNLRVLVCYILLKIVIIGVAIGLEYMCFALNVLVFLEEETHWLLTFLT